jgi:hypothetical protein
MSYSANFASHEARRYRLSGTIEIASTNYSTRSAHACYTVDTHGISNDSFRKRIEIQMAFGTVSGELSLTSELHTQCPLLSCRTEHVSADSVIPDIFIC